MYNSRKMKRAKDQWRSREYGFVDFESQPEAAAAIEALSGAQLAGICKDESSRLIVQYAKTCSTMPPAAEPL
jgi:RNA recognition motif-containing protein